MGALRLKTGEGGEEVKIYVDPVLTVISMLVAIVFVYIGLLFASKGREYSKDRAKIFKMVLADAGKLSIKSARSKFMVWRIALMKDIHNILIGGVITASGVCVMHYLGMAALSFDGVIGKFIVDFLFIYENQQ
jgi:NO-binding membrane sensor protein with MHYT domain